MYLDWPLAILCLESITCHLAEWPRHFLSPSPWGPTPGTQVVWGCRRGLGWGPAGQGSSPAGHLSATRLLLASFPHCHKTHEQSCPRSSLELSEAPSVVLCRDPMRTQPCYPELWHRNIKHNMNRKIVDGLSGHQSRPGRPL